MKRKIHKNAWVEWVIFTISATMLFHRFVFIMIFSLIHSKQFRNDDNIISPNELLKDVLPLCVDALMDPNRLLFLSITYYVCIGPFSHLCSLPHSSTLIETYQASGRCSTITQLFAYQSTCESRIHIQYIVRNWRNWFWFHDVPKETEYEHTIYNTHMIS